MLIKLNFKLPDTLCNLSRLFQDQAPRGSFRIFQKQKKRSFSLFLTNTISVTLLSLTGTRKAAKQVSARLVLCLMKQMNTLVEPFRVVRRWERQVRYSAHQIFKQYIPDSTTVFSDIPCWCRVQSVLCLFVCSMISYSMLQKLIHELRRGKIT